MRAPCSTKPAMAFASSSCSTLTREMLVSRGNRTRAIIPVGCAPFSAGGRYAGTSQSVGRVPRSFSYKDEQVCGPATPTRTPPALRRNPARTNASFKSSQVKSSQVRVKFIQSQQKKVFNLKYVKGSTSYTFITLLDTPHVSSISSQQKPSTFLRGLSCASIHTE